MKNFYKKVTDIFVFFILLICFSEIFFVVVSCEKQNNKQQNENINVVGSSQAPPLTFKFFNNPYHDCAINPVGKSPRLEWYWFQTDINYFRFCFSDTIYWENCNITNCLGEHVQPPLKQKLFLYQHQIPNGETVTLQYFSKSFCLFDTTGIWINYPAKEVTIKY